MLKISIITACISTMLSVTNIQAQTNKQENRTLIVFFDGLRPDYITPAAMPNLYAFRQQGAYGKQHHSVYPTVTRVNSSAYSTGSYPAKTGLMGNTVYFPEVDSLKGLNTGEAGELDRITRATNGKLLTTVSLGELLQAAGKRMMVFSSGSTGQALLQNHTLSGGAIVNPAMIRPASFKDEVIRTVGPVPAHAKPNSAQHRWVADALIKLGLAPGGPAVSAIWFSDPDGTAHADGIGAETSMASIKSVDEQFGRILAYLKESQQEKLYNIIISTDHGFVTHAGKKNISSVLIEKGLKKGSGSDDVMIAEGAIYVKDHNPELIQRIVSALQQQDFIGPVFTKGKKQGDLKGWVPGTLSLEAIHWNHPTRSADILVDEDWNDDKNKFGYAGTSLSGGVAGHGGFSPYEVHIALIVSGPAFKKDFTSDLPTSNVDIAPTVLYLQGLPVSPQMDGRVVYELMNDKRSSSSPSKAKTDSVETSTAIPAGTYSLSIHRTIVGKYVYIDYAKAKRKYKGDKIEPVKKSEK